MGPVRFIWRINMGFQQHYDHVQRELAQVCAEAGRSTDEVSVVAVSKTVGIDAVGVAISAGCTDFGENRPDMLAEKACEFPQACWHFIGNIQSRKIEEIVRYAGLIHSLYQRHHVEKIDAAARSFGKIQPVLLEVNISGETSKSGMKPDEAADFAAYVNSFDNVRACGLMTMAPQGDRKVARQCFEDLADLRESVQLQLPADEALTFNELSMGMSEDWQEAVLAGATIVRIGRALFSDTFDEI